MAGKKLNSSSGYFNEAMLAILEKGEAKKTKSTSTKKTGSKKGKKK